MELWTTSYCQMIGENLPDWNVFIFISKGNSSCQHVSPIKNGLTKNQTSPDASDPASVLGMHTTAMVAGINVALSEFVTRLGVQVNNVVSDNTHHMLASIKYETTTFRRKFARQSETKNGMGVIHGEARSRPVG